MQEQNQILYFTEISDVLIQKISYAGICYYVGYHKLRLAQLWYKIHVFYVDRTKITTGRRKKCWTRGSAFSGRRFLLRRN